MAATPTSPLWRRWKIKYDATLAEFEERAKHLDELRKQSGFLPEAKQARRILMMRQKSSKGGKRLSAFKSSPKIQRKPGKGRRHAK
jgi:hypothetical protein